MKRIIDEINVMRERAESIHGQERENLDNSSLLDYYKRTLLEKYHGVNPESD